VASDGSSQHGGTGWDEIHEFASLGEFNRFLRWIADAVEEGVLIEVAVLDRYDGSTIFDERWYRSAVGEVWRVVAPDFPFKGVFLRVRPEPAR